MTTNPIPAEEWPAQWVRDTTLVRFFAGEPGADQEIAIIDGVTGLRWVLENGQPGDSWILDESVWPIADRWVFTATYLVGDGAEVSRGFRTMREEGFYGGDGVGYAALQAELSTLAESPWDYPGSPILYAMYPEREARLSVCHACEFFNHADSVCTLDEAFIPTKTIDGGQVCPDGRWGQAPSWDAATAGMKYAAAVVNAPSQPTPEQLAEQAAFEAEWEATH